MVARMIADLCKLQPLECGYFLQHSWFLPSWNSSRTPYCFPLPLLSSLSFCLIDGSFSGFWEGLLFCFSSHCHAFVLAGGSHQEEGVPQGDVVKPRLASSGLSSAVTVLFVLQSTKTMSFLLEFCSAYICGLPTGLKPQGWKTNLMLFPSSNYWLLSGICLSFTL